MRLNGIAVEWDHALTAACMASYLLPAGALHSIGR